MVGPEHSEGRSAALAARGDTPFIGSRNLDGTPSVGGGRKTPRPCPRLLNRGSVFLSAQFWGACGKFASKASAFLASSS